jgi:hypothetical protein
MQLCILYGACARQLGGAVAGWRADQMFATMSMHEEGP